MDVKYICTGCLSNKSLIKYVLEHHEKRLRECPICHQRNHYAISCEVFADYILSCFDHNYSDLSERDGTDYDPDTDSFFYVDNDETVELTSIYEVLEENCVLNSSIIDYDDRSEIYQKIIKSYASQRSIYSYLAETGWTHAQSNDLFFSWESFNYLVQNNNRFFEFGNQSRENYLEKIISFLSEFENDVPAGTILYRIRNANSLSINIFDNLDLVLKEIAPPPCKYTKSYRMSPRGISYTYVSSDIKTCLKECGVRKKNKVLIGKFSTKKSLRFLDLEMKSLPYYDLFSGQFDREQQNIWRFIEAYTSEISRPVKPDQDYEYLSTQVIAEYIRLQGYYGIAYSSSKTNKTNYVFFYGPDYYKYSDIKPKGWNSYIDTVPAITNAFDLEGCAICKITDSRSCKYDIIKATLNF